MKKHKFILTILLLFAINSYSQNLDKLSLNSKLSDLSKSWGILKYHHPGIASGTVNWDSCLLFSIKKVLNDSSTNIQNEIKNLILIAEKNQPPTSKNNISKKISTNDSFFKSNYFLTINDTIKQFLEKTIKGDHAPKNYYMQRKWDLLDFSFEKNYTDQLPDVEYRLLGLFRFWNIIEFFYPYKNLMDSDWDQLLLKYIPLFQQCKNREEYFWIVSEFLTKLDDGHALVFDKYRFDYTDKYELPIHFKWIGKKMVVADINSRKIKRIYKINAGDYIVKINNRTVDEEIKRWSRMAPASNEERKMNIISIYFYHGTSKRMLLKIAKQNGDTVSIACRLKSQNAFRRNVRDIKDLIASNRKIRKTTKQLKSAGIGFINGFGNNNKGITKEYRVAKQNKAIIIDMRDYPKADLMFLFNQYLFKEKKIFIKYIIADSVYAGRFNIQYDSLSRLPNYGDKNLSYYTGKIVVLVNTKTLSNAEWVVMGLQTQPNVFVIGSQTAGADGNIAMVPMPGGFKACFSGLGVEYPDGTQTQRTGLKIDVKVQETMRGLLSGKDEVLETAIDFIKK